MHPEHRQRPTAGLPARAHRALRTSAAPPRAGRRAFAGVWFLLLAVAGTAGAQTAGSPQAPELVDHARARGQKIVAQAFGTLSSNLLSALNRGGVTNALQFCSVAALPLTAAIAETNGVTLRRVSLRARNPRNQAGPEDRTLLEQFQAGLIAGGPPTARALTNASGGALFIAPIVINHPLCLNCHGQPGTDIQPDHLALLRRLYPNDQATGYKFGDLRGLWRVEFPPAALTPSKPEPK